MLNLVIAAAEPSKVPFYLLGGVLAGWAVVLAGIGLMRPSFPDGRVGERGVLALSFVFVIAAIAAAILTSK